MLPLLDGYVDERSRTIIGQASWSAMLLPWTLDLLPNCVEREKGNRAGSLHMAASV